MSNQRPITIKEGAYREYVTEQNMIKIDQYTNGEWVNVVTTAFIIDETEDVLLPNGRIQKAKKS